MRVGKPRRLPCPQDLASAERPWLLGEPRAGLARKYEIGSDAFGGVFLGSEVIPFMMYLPDRVHS